MKRIAIVIPYLKEDENDFGKIKKEFAKLNCVDDTVFLDAQIDIITTTATQKCKSEWEQSVPEGMVRVNGLNIRRFEIDNSYTGRMRKSSIAGSEIDEYYMRCEVGPVSYKLVKYVQQNCAQYDCIILGEDDSFVSYSLRNCEGNSSKRQDEIIKPAFGADNVAICLASDDNYVPYLAVAIQSVLQKACVGKGYDFLILSDNISHVNRRMLEAMVVRENAKIRFVEISNLLGEYQFSFRCKQLSRCAFARLLLPQLLEAYSKSLYLDCDVIASADVSKLYEIEITDYMVAAVKDPYVDILRKSEVNESAHIRNEVGLSDENAYFNSGVLLLNLDAFRKKYSSEEMLDLASSREWMWEDQDVLNKLCKGHVKWIQPGWNLIWGQDEQIRAMMRINREYNEAYNNPFIIHYAGGCLPTKSLLDDFGADFWIVARKTPYYEKLYDMHIQLLYNEFVDRTNSDNVENISCKPSRTKNFIKKLVTKLVGSIITPIRVEEKKYCEISKSLLEELLSSK